ncbi:MAG TPA: D-hexose-6-phosphate mutarotase [Terrimicrobiaceae bacterium]|nr:D-hexose-6-phosphate mutarotase [Terrimicrobiaceae bacterium]
MSRIVPSQIAAPTGAELRDRFGPVSGIEFRDEPAGRTRVVIANRHASAQVLVHGACVVHYQPQGSDPVLWFGRHNQFEPGAVIHGGIPICWPWFDVHLSNPALPDHGFARLLPWELHAIQVLPDDSTSLEWGLASNALTRSLWPHEFDLRYRIDVGERLKVTLEMSNRSADEVAIEVALHSYLAVSDVHQIRIDGLAGTELIDKTRRGERRRHEQDPLRIAEETDHVFLKARGPCRIVDPQAKRCLHIENQGTDCIVVWNPWRETARTLPDFGADEWQEMVCVEAANVADYALRLAPGQIHVMGTALTCEPLA